MRADEFVEVGRVFRLYPAAGFETAGLKCHRQTVFGLEPLGEHVELQRPDDAAELEKFVRAYPSSMANDLDGAPVFLAQSAFNLRYDQERWPAIRFADIKDYQKAETGKGRQKALV